MSHITIAAQPYPWPYNDAGNHAAALKMITMQYGVFGAVSSSRQLLEVVH
jgi:hypothetical protein